MALSVEAQIKKSLIKAMQFALGKVAWEDSQEEVPVVTGQLKKSGHFERTRKGFTIIYDAPYATAVHDGQEAEVTNEVYSSMVREHDRRLANGSTVRVRSHTKNYTGMKPTKVRSGGWAVLPIKGSRKANPFVTRPLERRMEELFGSSAGLQKYMPKTIKADRLKE